MRCIFRPISAGDMATSCLVMPDPPPKASEVLTGSSMQIKFQMETSGQKNWAKNLGKMKYFPKLANMLLLLFLLLFSSQH